MRVLLLCLAVSMCATPDYYCRGRIDGETMRDMVADALEDCAPMLRITVEL